MRVFLLLPLAALLATIPFARSGSTAAPKPSAMPLPQYDSSGALLQPKNFEHWTFVGSNIGMSYDAGEHNGPGEFHNIYTQSEAFDAYKATGKFPDQLRSGSAAGSASPASACARRRGRRAGIRGRYPHRQLVIYYPASAIARADHRR